MVPSTLSPIATDSILYSIMSWRLPEFCTMRATMGRKGRRSMCSMYTRCPAISDERRVERICVIKTLKKCNQRETKETNLELDTSAEKARRGISGGERIYGKEAKHSNLASCSNSGKKASDNLLYLIYIALPLLPSKLTYTSINNQKGKWVYR